MDVVIVTGDRDSYQLVRTRTSRSSTTSAASPTTRSTTRRASLERTGRHARAVPRLRGAARRHERQPAGRAGHRREDRREARSPPTASLEGDLRAPRRAAAEAADEPRRGQGPRVQEPRDVACSHTRRRSRRLDSGRPAAWARSTARRCSVLFNQLEFRLFLPRLLDAVGDVAETPDGRHARASTC